MFVPTVTLSDPHYLMVTVFCAKISLFSKVQKVQRFPCFLVRFSLHIDHEISVSV